MSRLSEVLLKYAETFGENFPTRMVSMKEEDLIRLVQGCIDKGEPYNPEDNTPTDDF